MTGRDGYIVADWNGCDGLRYFNNVIVADQGDTSVSIGPQTRNVTFQNNICTGNNLELLRAAGKLDLGHNIYTSSNPRGGKLEAGSLIADLATIFVDPAKRDYRLKAGSPAIGAGVAVGLDKDLVGARLPQGKAPDIGVYQYSAAH
jgi:hypothetical protein